MIDIYYKFILYILIILAILLSLLIIFDVHKKFFKKELFTENTVTTKSKNNISEIKGYIEIKAEGNLNNENLELLKTTNKSTAPPQGEITAPDAPWLKK